MTCKISEIYSLLLKYKIYISPILLVEFLRTKDSDVPKVYTTRGIFFLTDVDHAAISMLLYVYASVSTSMEVDILCRLSKYLKKGEGEFQKICLNRGIFLKE